MLGCTSSLFASTFHDRRKRLEDCKFQRLIEEKQAKSEYHEKDDVTNCRGRACNVFIEEICFVLQVSRATEPAPLHLRAVVKEGV